MTKRILFSGLMLILMAFNAHAQQGYIKNRADLFVSPAGSDHASGTKGKPFKTLYRACEKARKNSVIHLSAGVFEEEKPCKIPYGVSVKGAGEDRTIIKSRFYYTVTRWDTSPEHFILQVDSTNHATFSDFSIDGDARKTHGGLMVHNTKNSVLKNLKLSNFNFCALWLTNAAATEISHCDIENGAWPSNYSCSGAVMFGDLTSCSVHDLKIRDDRAYGIKHWAYNWLSSKPYTQPGFKQALLKNVDFYNLDILVEPKGAWAGGTSPNFTMELWNAELVNCTLHHCSFNETVSIPSKSTLGQEKTIELYDNRFIMSKGAPSYAIEAGCTNLVVHHNYFNGGYYPLASFGGTVTGHKIYSNVFEDIWGVSIIHHFNVKDCNIYNNTIYSNKNIPLITLKKDSQPEGLVITHNLFYAHADSVITDLLAAEGASWKNVLITKNWFYHWKPSGTEYTTGNPQLKLSGIKPAIFFKPLKQSRLTNAKIGALKN